MAARFDEVLRANHRRREKIRRSGNVQQHIARIFNDFHSQRNTLLSILETKVDMYSSENAIVEHPINRLRREK